jgi:light-regulated signal transduction histidine kinase (bacteriophytochrome)
MKAGAQSLDGDVESALAQVVGTIQESGATVTHEPLPIVKAEHGEIARLFLNLVGNAIKYRSSDRVPRVHVSAVSSGDG